MKKATIGNTSLHVSRLGLGTVKFGRNEKVNYPTSFNLPTDTEIADLLYLTKDLGINLLDTAPAYGNSEERLGKFLKNQRHDWIVSSKVGEIFQQGQSQFNFHKDWIIQSVDQSLSRLKTDYLDIVLVHSNGDDVKIIEQDEVFEPLASLKEAGKIRAYGMSTKTLEGGLLALQHSDIAMVTYNPTYTDEAEVISYAKQHQKNIFIKKALASGHLDKIAGNDPVRAAMDFIFKQPGVTSVIVGTLNHAHLKHNVDCVNAALT